MLTTIMMSRNVPRYPVYIPSKGRADACLTARFLDRDGVPFFLVVEADEHDAYAERFGEARILVLPFANQGSVVPARNWIKEHATAAGHGRHWQLDDNISHVCRMHKGYRVPCNAGPALAICEDFTDRYENVAISGMNYCMFAPAGANVAPFTINQHIYSCCLILNSLPYRWRGRYNEDTDYCLQALAGGWCTILFHAFLVQKVATMVMRGGNAATLYQGDGRLRMARALERLWPGVVETKRRWKRPQHVVKNSWFYFDTPLRPKETTDVTPNQDEYGLVLTEIEPVQSPVLRRLIDDARRVTGETD